VPIIITIMQLFIYLILLSDEIINKFY